MSDLLPFGKTVKITHKYMNNEWGWVTAVKPSFFVGHDYQYLVRSEHRLRSGKFNWGGVWFDEMDIKVIEDKVLPKFFNLKEPEGWGSMTEIIGRRPGIWGINGAGVNQDMINKMLSWKPGAITCFYDYIQANGVESYKNEHPDVPIIIRFQHDKNWRENREENAKNKAAEIISKWPTIKHLDPYVYFCNEVNLHYENGDNDPSTQWFYESAGFYKVYGIWVTELADRIKQAVPEIKLVCPPFAYGHNEDGVPTNGIPKLGWSGYEPLLYAIKTYFDNTICGHYYWGNSGGSVKEWLYGEESAWHAFRWRKVLELFKVSYGMDVKMIIDEAGNFATRDNDFTDQIVYYADETLKDERILALTYFLYHDPTNSPGNILNDWQRIPDLDTHLNVLKNWELNTELPEPEPEPEPEPDYGYKMTFTYESSSLPLLVGNYPKKGIDIYVYPPYGKEYKVVSGSKPEYGEGGFEAGYASYQGVYLLNIEGVDYEIYSKADGSLIRVNFKEGNSIQVVVLESKQITIELAQEIMNDYPNVFIIKEQK